MEEAPENQKETKTLDNDKYTEKMQIKEVYVDRKEAHLASRRVVEASTLKKPNQSNQKSMEFEKLSPEMKKSLKLGETVITEYIENTDSIAEKQSDLSRSSVLLSENNKLEERNEAGKKNKKHGSAKKTLKQDKEQEELLAFLKKSQADTIKPVALTPLIMVLTRFLLV